MDMTDLLRETLVVKTDEDTWALKYLQNPNENLMSVTTPDGNPIVHTSKDFLLEIQSELKLDTPKELTSKLSFYQIVSSEIEEFGKTERAKWESENCPFYINSKEDVYRLLINDPIFHWLVEPYQKEKENALINVTRFLKAEVGLSNFNEYLIIHEIDPQLAEEGHKKMRIFPDNNFDTLWDYLHNYYIKSSLSQKVTIHHILHSIDCSNENFELLVHYPNLDFVYPYPSIMISIAFAQKYLKPTEFALACLVSCDGMVPSMIEDDEIKKKNEYIEDYSRKGHILLNYLDKTESPLIKILSNGEDKHTEFKSTFRINLHTKQIDKNMETASLKGLVAFLNTEGGTLVIGVEDNMNILGLIQDLFPDKNNNIESQKDRYKNHISYQFASRVSPNLSQYLNYKWEWYQDKLILLITCDKLPKNQIAYLDSEIWVRNEAQNSKLTTAEAIDWQNNRNI